MLKLINDFSYLNQSEIGGFMSKQKLKLGVPDQEGQLSIMFTRGGPRTGAGRKGIGETRKVSLTLTKEMWDELDKRCTVSRLTRSEILRDMIESYLATN
ncbi:ribbon-helix-helix domain-containing protein [Paenibacillus sp. MBLB4367]|uniref:ribbon-helix-helix domain-containing protein n=1 Tax=Paenibacillus sp. MBLB4367 TaxID=3384767 RepID=UPI0039081EA8